MKKAASTMKFFCVMTGLLLPFVALAQEDEQQQFNTTFRGNQELPQVLYIVPWATPPGPGQVDPLVPHSGNVFQRTFSPVERLETQRRLRYYSQSHTQDGDSKP